MGKDNHLGKVPAKESTKNRMGEGWGRTLIPAKKGKQVIKIKTDEKGDRQWRAAEERINRQK